MTQVEDEGADRKQRLAEAFSRAAEGYRSLPGFRHFGRRLAERADIGAGARVLDVACGRGAVLFRAAELAGPTGRVIGVDLAPGMAKATADEAYRLGLTQVDVRLMDAENLGFTDACFDRVLCGFAVFFFPRPWRTLAELKRVLVPGGRLAISTWGQGDPRWDWEGELLRSHTPSIAPRPDSTPDGPAPKFRTLEGLRDYLTTGGFGDVHTSSEAMDYWFESREAWWEQSWHHGTRVYLEAITEARGAEGLELLKADAFSHLEQIREPRGYPVRWTALFATAVSPG